VTKKEKNKRLAETMLPGGEVIKREWTPKERYMLFRVGFGDGASLRSMQKKLQGLGAYDRGYGEGQNARVEAMNKYAEEIGYKPSILRLQGD
jgi:hypothetical protein